MIQDVSAGVEQIRWGAIGGKEVWLLGLKNKRGTKLYVSNFGATAQALFFRDRNGGTADVLLGYDTLEDYTADTFYMGTVVGRYANRIAGGDVMIEGRRYKLPLREGGYHLHGGRQGFNKKVFDCRVSKDAASTTARFGYTSKHGEEGFPGTLRLEVAYTLDDDDRWTITYKAASDKTTLVNLTQHAYFNLTGNPAHGIAGHELKIFAPSYLPVNALQVPTGIIADVEDTPFDFRAFKPIGNDISTPHEQLQLSGGYDHSFVLETRHTYSLKHAAAVREAVSGRTLDVYTTEPAVHLYTGNFLQHARGKNNKTYDKRFGFCLETQHFPDAPNHPHFPSTVLQTGTEYNSKTIYQFATF